MADEDDPLDVAMRRPIPAGFQQNVSPEQATAQGLQWTGGSTGWQPYVVPQQATAQNLSYTGGAFTPNAHVMIDPYANVPPPGPGGGAYGQTDVWSDPNWLRTMSTRRDRLGRAAQSALDDLPRQQALAQRDQVLQQHQLNFEANQRRIMAHQGATEAHRQLSLDRDTEIDEQGAGMLQSLMGLDAGLRKGLITKDQYDNGLLQAGQQFPLGLRHPEAARHFEFAINEADKQNAYTQRREATQAEKLGAKYGIGAQLDPDTGLPSVAHTQLAALQTPKGKVEAFGQMNREMFQKYGVPTGVGSLFNPIEPHTSDDEGKTINLPFHDPKAEGGVGKLKVPAPLFEQMKADFNDRYFALNPPSALTAGAVPTTQTAAPAATPKIGEVRSGYAFKGGNPADKDNWESVQ